MEQTLQQATNINNVLAKRPLIISGPCSAETEEQVLKIGQKKTRLNLLPAPHFAFSGY